MIQTLDLVEQFVEIQGEGVRAGLRTHFLRFQGCDFNCNFCDENSHHNHVMGTPVYDIVQMVRDGGATSVTLTGGNPAMHDLESLIEALHLIDVEVNMETQGSLFPKWLHLIDLLTISPKHINSGNATDLTKLREELDRIDGGWTEFQIKPLVFVDKDGNVSKDDLEYLELIVKNFNDCEITAQLGDDSIYTGLSYNEKYGALVAEIGKRREWANVRVLPQLHKMANVR